LKQSESIGRSYDIAKNLVKIQRALHSCK